MPGYPDNKDAVLEEQKRIVVRMQDELDKMIKLFSWARECVENELTEGMGFKKIGLPDKAMKKLKELAAMCNEVVGAKIRYDKAAKQMADTMTPEEERYAVIQYLKSASVEDRKYVIRKVTDWMNTRLNGPKDERQEFDESQHGPTSR